MSDFGSPSAEATDNSNSSKPTHGAANSGRLTHAAALTASAAGELANGAGMVLKGKAMQIAENFQERVNQTVGGQVATAIRTEAPEQDIPKFDGNALSGAHPDREMEDIDDEVAAFVNRTVST